MAIVMPYPTSKGSSTLRCFAAAAMMKNIIELLPRLLSGKGSAAAMDTLCCGSEGCFAAAAGNVDRHSLLRLLFAILIIIRIICKSSVHPHLLLEPGLLRQRSVLEA
ncbi:unnamed protein product [Heligmosomoides polygyrus]|uniref:Secreted protein n=1 Tax=Heligmosomoides polygyrus TaxID=6339 RepID=A0A183FWU2_HELPZ|nr:unnamed protein product [Heligmosomoides polygyrus]